MNRSHPVASRLPTPVFTLGQIVYQHAAPEEGGMVTGILYRPGAVIYMVSWAVGHCADETQHWECELTGEKAFGAAPTEG